MKVELSLIKTKSDYEKALDRIRPLMRKGDEVSDDELCADYILPAAFDKRVGPTVAEAVKKAARESGVARI